ncbi:hypothetical protein QTO34_000562 [Cnephaeus nilssonii]|uniref:Uncharacterized protein n=1 Tax=Cnephaeus nilssonii TaxID=3371016 RepID=A0AA40IBM6_CNENI|nr:hypothetical protein QTO34_000562 [Eptesicus nilssonii]
MCCYHPFPVHPPLDWLSVFPPLALQLLPHIHCCSILPFTPKPSSHPHPISPLKLSRPNNPQHLRAEDAAHCTLKQLLQQKVEGLAGSKCAPLNGSSSLDMVELQSLLAEIPRTLNAPEHNSGAFRLPELLQHSGLPKPCFLEECGEPQLCPGAEPEAAQSCPPAEPGPPKPCHRREPEIPEPTTQKQSEVSEACPPIEPGSIQACSQRQTGLPEPSPGVEPEESEAFSLEPRSTESSPQSCCGQWDPTTTSSLRPPAGQAGPRSLAPRTLALRQCLKACLTTISCFHEAHLDDECAFYTS